MTASVGDGSSRSAGLRIDAFVTRLTFACRQAFCSLAADAAGSEVIFEGLVSVPEARVHAPLTASSTDTQLVERIRSGDERACESLYLTFYEPLWRSAFGYVRSSPIAEEIVQDVFMALWRAAPA